MLHYSWFFIFALVTWALTTGYFPIAYKLDTPDRLEFLAFKTDDNISEVEPDQFIRENILNPESFEDSVLFERVSLW